MCGIVGIISKDNFGFYHNCDDIFEELLYTDAVRGMDSTGVFMTTLKNQVHVLKQATNPGIFLTTKEWKDFKSRINPKGRIVIGHNRKATQGEVTTPNAHPFIKSTGEGDNKTTIALVHNGVIPNHKELDANVSVDSEAIVSALLAHEDPMEAIKKLTGAWALAWYNHRTKKFYLARNDQRPLHLAEVGGVFYMASEAEMLKWVLGRNKKMMHFEVQALKEYTLVEMSFNPYSSVHRDIPRRVIHGYNKWPHQQTPDVSNHPFFEGDLWELVQGWDVKESESCDANEDNGTVADAEFELEAEEGGPELARIKAEARREALKAEESPSIEELEIAQLMRLYPQDSKVLFKAQNFYATPGEGQTIEGHIWVPGKPMQPAKWRLPYNEDTQWIWGKPTPMVATVQFIHRRDKRTWFQLSKVEEPITVLDINKNAFVKEEWEAICEVYGCDTCAGAPRPHQIDVTDVRRTSLNHYAVTCADCIGKKTEPQAANG